MSDHFDSMIEGLTDLLEFAKGDSKKARVRIIEQVNLRVKPLNRYSKEEIKSIRLKHNLTMQTFADCLGVSRKTVESWERGDNTPSGSSIRLFELLEKNTNILEEYEILTKA